MSGIIRRGTFLFLVFVLVLTPLGGLIREVKAATPDIIITGVIDGPLTGGLPKAIEVYVVHDIPDLSIYGLGSANNGGGSDGEEFTFPADSGSAGDFIYIATEATEFTNWFGFAPDYTDSAVNINGDDAIELFQNGAVIDVFGEINIDGTGQPWEYLDGWAYRVSDTGPDGSTFVLANWTFSLPNALDGETSNATAAAPFPTGSFVPPATPDIIITGVIDGPLTGGLPKAVEVYVVHDIPDLSIYGLGSANNGGGTDGEEFTFPAVSASADDFIYIASESTRFTSWFGFAPDYTDSAVNINGDDAIELFQNGAVIDVFGEINVDGTGQAWEYTDGWAYRVFDTGPDGSTFALANWTFSGPNALDGETTNATAAAPFPAGSYASFVPPATPDIIITGVIDGPLTGGLPKAVEVYVVQDIPDLSIYGIGSANNGGGSDGEEFTFPADSAAAGDFIYIATESTEFTNWFGFGPDYTHGTSVNINGDDAIELFQNGAVIDIFGDINTIGTGQPWEYTDGWAYRVSGTGPDGSTFVLANWTFSLPNALDGETSNPTAAAPFPTGSYTLIGDTTDPTVTIDQGSTQADPTNTSPIVFDVVFSENVTGFAAADVSISGMAGAPTITVTSTGTGDTYTVEVGGLASGETVSASIPANAAQDAAGNDNKASTSTDNSVTYDPTDPTVTIDQGSAQADPTNTSPIVFDVVFSENVSGFAAADVSISGMAGAPTITVTSTGTGDTYTVEVGGMASGETISASIPANAAQDATGNDNEASTSTDNSVTYDPTAIFIASDGILAQTGGVILKDFGVYNIQFTSLEITFTEDASDPAGSNDPDDATNPDNYLLIQSGPNAIYDTTSCLDVSNNGGAVLGDDIQIPTGPVAYNAATYTSTVTLNTGTPLPYGDYRLIVCGTTSIVDLAGNALNGGVDTIVNFTLVSAVLPKTGFAPGQVTQLPKQSLSDSYQQYSDVSLEIPSQGLKASIVGVPVSQNGWNLAWLGNQAGWLHGTAFPSWAGNSAITAHVYDANGQPGLFNDLGQLKWGDEVIVHAYGQAYVYEVRTVDKFVQPDDISSVYQHEDYPWLTLITCQGYDEESDAYRWRVIVRAVQIKID